MLSLMDVDDQQRSMTWLWLATQTYQSVYPVLECCGFMLLLMDVDDQVRSTTWLRLATQT